MMIFLKTINFSYPASTFQCPTCVFNGGLLDWALLNIDLFHLGASGTCPEGRVKFETWTILLGTKCCCDGIFGPIFISNKKN